MKIIKLNHGNRNLMFPYIGACGDSDRKTSAY